MTNDIVKRIDLAAPVSRVWQALTDHRAFGTWFRVALDQPFVVGATVTGHVTYEGYEHLRFACDVVEMVPERRFAIAWHPYAIDPQADYSDEPKTEVVFTLEPIDTGTRLTVTESGFDALPAGRAGEAFRMNDGGWSIQMQNIAEYVGGL